MKNTIMLTALSSMFSFGVQSVTANCFGSGETWNNKELARSFIHDACYNNGGMFTGFFEPRQMKSMCPRSGDQGLRFDVQNQNVNTGFDLGDDDCYDRLTNEIFGCEHGGSSVISGWYFLAQPGGC